MSDQNLGAISPDGYFYWDGAGWRSAVSPDGAWRWDGAAWAPMQPSGFRAAKTYASAGDLGLAVSILLGITAAVSIVEANLVYDFFELSAWAGDFRVKYTFGIFGMVAFAVTAVLFLVWFHRSHSNLTALGARDLRFSSAAAVAWWMVPVAGLWKPYGAAVEIWKAGQPDTESTGRGGVALIGWWWAAWLVSLFFVNLASVAVPDTEGLYWESGLAANATVLAAVLAIFVVRSVTERQDERWRQLAARVPAQVGSMLQVEPGEASLVAVSGSPRL